MDVLQSNGEKPGQNLTLVLAPTLSVTRTLALSVALTLTPKDFTTMNNVQFVVLHRQFICVCQDLFDLEFS